MKREEQKLERELEQRVGELNGILARNQSDIKKELKQITNLITS